MGLFLYHVLRANDDNAVGADDFVAQLCDENDTILESMITTEVIQGFIDECDKGKEEPRLLALLTALCASQNGPIVSNQIDVVRILTEQEEARNKLLMPLSRLKKRHEIKVTLDMGEDETHELVAISRKNRDLRAQHKKMQEKDPDWVMSHEDEHFLIDYDCFCQQLDLFAETCLNRNKENQKKLSVFFEGKLLIDIFQYDKFDFRIRSKALKFYLEACLDMDPFKKIVVPAGLAVFSELTKLEYESNELVEQIESPDFNFEIK